MRHSQIVRALCVQISLLVVFAFWSGRLDAQGTQPPANAGNQANAANPPAAADDHEHADHDHDHDHHHGHSHPHPTVKDEKRFFTNRKSDVDLPLPTEEDAFFFAVFGDRTGGPDAGIEILKQTVKDTNVLEPDLVMTVGDLVQGYNQTDRWIEQMKEYKGVMNDLVCPWFPVAGNHDVYWRGPGKPEGEHEKEYEMYFGPLWYAFEHKDCFFIALYSDEGNPETGEKTFGKPEAQKMSPEQFGWLKETLEKAKEAKHVFVFLHHPRWLGGGYGDDWDRVHKLLAANGNVRAVFAGHIHRMRYDGQKDGIEYVTLATVGGSQSGAAPQAGYLHQFHIITVRDKQIAMASLPVGEVQDVRKITGEVSEQAFAVAKTVPKFDGEPKYEFGEAAKPVKLSFSYKNPTDRPLEVTALLDCADNRWVYTPDHAHVTIPAGESKTFEFNVGRINKSGPDEALRLPELVLNVDLLAKGLRVSIPEKRIPTPIKLAEPAAE